MTASAAASGRLLGVSYRFLTPELGVGGAGLFSPLAFLASASSTMPCQSFASFLRV